MPGQGRRSARTETLFRAVNAEIEKLERGLAHISDRTLHIVCECADLECAELIVVPTVDYERIRADAAMLIVKPGHDKREVEEVVEETEQIPRRAEARTRRCGDRRRGGRGLTLSDQRA